MPYKQEKKTSLGYMARPYFKKTKTFQVVANYALFLLITDSSQAETTSDEPH